MIDMKPYQDALLKAQDAATEVALQIDALMQDEKEEEALALQSELDEAEAKVQQAEHLYNSMAKVTEQRGADPARNFVPVSDEQPDHQLESEQPDETVLTLAEYNSLSPKERLAFAKSGGTLSNEKE